MNICVYIFIYTDIHLELQPCTSGCELCFHVDLKVVLESQNIYRILQGLWFELLGFDHKLEVL